MADVPRGEVRSHRRVSNINWEVIVIVGLFASVLGLIIYEIVFL